MSEFTQVHCSVNKKSRLIKTKNNDRDIISTLPESIVIRILCLLPTKEAVRTCVLSKDWEHKWIEIDTIEIYDRGLLSDIYMESFDNFVDKILRLSPIKRFHLNKYCSVRVPVGKCFSQLKNLYLEGVEIWNERSPHTSQLVFNFPVLESLELQKCLWLNVESLEFDAPVLKMFKACRCLFKAGICKIKLSGTTLETFETRAFSLENIVLSESSVGYDQLSSDRRYGLQARTFLKGVSGLKHLNLSAAIFTGLSRTQRELPLPKFDELKQLEIFIEHNNEAFLELLNAASSLETLIINAGPTSNVDFELESVPPCVASHLKEVQFHGCHGFNEQNHLAKYFRKNALKLKKLSIGNDSIVMGHDEEGVRELRS